MKYVDYVFFIMGNASFIISFFDEYFDEIIGTLQITKLEFYEK